jgi:lysophospholipase L1-like esterase
VNQIEGWKLKNKKAIIVLAVFLALVTLVYSIDSIGTSPNNQNGKLARVACMGDSITEVSGYPEDLQALLGNDSVVGNFGVRGATVSFGSVNPYYFTEKYPDAVEFQPTTVVLMLGTNDARTDTYELIESFVSNYKQIIEGIQTSKDSSKAQIYLVKPPPVFENDLNISSTDLANGIIPKIEQVAQELNLPIIDLYTPLLNHPEYYLDGVHLNSEGAQYIANTIYEAIKNQ